MKMKFPLLTSLVLLTLQGCASHKIGPEATFVSEADRNNPPHGSLRLSCKES